MSQRQCGDCTLCCKLLRVDELQKPASKWCNHCKPTSGCSIYNSKPTVCNEFECAWLAGYLSEDAKPSKSKVVVCIAGDDEIGVYLGVLIDPTYNRPIPSEIARFVSHYMKSMKVIIDWGDSRGRVFLSDPSKLTRTE